MANPFFAFKSFTVFHDRCAMKVTTDSCLFGAWCAAQMQTMGSPRKALDIGTGTGLLSLMVAQKNASAIDAVEIDPGAVGQASENVQRAQFPCNIQLVCADVRETELGTYDAIICNPPFYERDLEGPAHLKNMAHHSSRLTWEELLPLVASGLSDDGSFYLLLPYKRVTEAVQAITNAGLCIHHNVIVRPSVHHDPFRVMIRGSKVAGETVITELSIKGADEQYTPEFIELLKDYYLYL